MKPTAEIPVWNIGLLVRFRDVHDARTIERVDPENLAASFGPGLKVVRETVAITDAPLTTGLEKRLPWLAAKHSVNLLFPENAGRPIDDVPPLQLLAYEDFWKGMR